MTIPAVTINTGQAMPILGFGTWQLRGRKAHATGATPAVNQIRWSPAEYDAERLAHSRDRGVVLEGYSPFRASRLGDPVLAEIATDHGVSPAQVILRWHVEHGVPVIPKSAHDDRIRANADIFGFSLGAEEMRRLDRLSRLG